MSEEQITPRSTDNRRVISHCSSGHLKDGGGGVNIFDGGGAKRGRPILIIPAESTHPWRHVNNDSVTMVYYN
jgi:hypothetical protein